MKTFFLVLVSIALAVADYDFSPEEKERYDKFNKECSEELKVDASLYLKFDEGTFVDLKDTKCLHKCVINKYGYFDDKEEFILDKIKAGISEKLREKYWAVLEKCLKVTGADACERSYEAHKCYVNNKQHL